MKVGDKIYCKKEFVTDFGFKITKDRKDIIRDMNYQRYVNGANSDNIIVLQNANITITSKQLNKYFRTHPQTLRKKAMNILSRLDESM